VPDPIWKQQVKKEDWFLGNTYHLSIGQGDLLTTPIQILQSINTIANKGKLLAPRFVERIENAAGEIVKSFEPEIIRENFINKDYLAVAAEGMRMSVSEGIIYPLRNAKLPVAAKTGTAEFGTKDAKGQYETHAWVAGFAPYDEPEISFILLLESGGASSNAAEAAKEILDWYFGR
ncbi:MAG: peptidoglycan glycosyltransferase, partial [Candidatus Cloacimonetes bacterium]|nr:peptidoglycan glycosyltransferase [Candidatus Cloacimonadota bacterium]